VRISKSVRIERPIEQVWAFIADPRNDPQWCGKVEAVEQVAGDGADTGARYAILHRPVRHREAKPLEVEIQAFEPPRRLRMREEDADAVFTVTYDLEQADEATRLTQSDEIDWKIALPLRPLGGLMVSRDLKRQFASLKRLLERQNQID
jgi:uncharacterized protein YndB with AHSA1/START domain